MNKESMKIDEVDSIIRLGNPSSKIPAYLAWLITLAIWAVGSYGLYQALLGNLAIIGVLMASLAAFISKAYMFLILYGVLILLVAIIGSFILLYLVKVAARVVLYIVFAIMPLILIGSGALFLYMGSTYGGLISIITGLFAFTILLFYRNRLSLAGRAMQLSAQAILDEKGTILAMFIASIFGMATFVMLSFASTYIGDYVYFYTRNSDYGVYAGAVTFFLGSWSIAFVSYLMNGTVAGIVHDWYRSPHVDVASFGKGLKRALKVQGGIALYALLMVTLRFIVEYLKSKARKSGALADVVAAGVASLLSDIIKLLTIYAIPAMVVRETGFKEGVKDSYHKLKDLFIETLASSFGFGFVIAIFGIIITVFYGVVGYLIGAYVIFPIATAYLIPGTPLLVGIVSAISFILIGLIPTILIFNTLGIAFTTILYEFGLDIEFSKKGISLPRRLPEDIEREFKETLAAKGISLS
ncbi:MAG: hypothetical protein ACP6IP_06530 [Candidatus Njordarchaeia archaeon]